MKFCVVALCVWATLAMAWFAWIHRWTTNTANGRFYRTDRWTGRTLVVEKDGSCRLLPRTAPVRP